MWARILIVIVLALHLYNHKRVDYKGVVIPIFNQTMENV